MQTENIYRKEEANLKRPDEFPDTREHAKLEGRFQGEEEHAGSQPSTIQSLNDVPDRETPSSKDNVGSLGQVKETIKEGVSNLQGDIKQKADQFKGKLTEKFGEEVQPEKDLAPESKQHVKEINEEIRHHPHGEEQIVEGQGHAQGQQGESQLPDLRFAPKEVVDKAIDKFEEVIHKGEELKKDVKQKVEEKAPQFDSHQNQPTTHEGHEHHQLSAESRSFVPTQETHQLIEKVKEGLEESVPLTEKIEELEHEKQQSQEKEQPVKEQIKQSIQGASDYVADKAQEVKQDVNQKKEEIIEERKPLVDKIMGRIHEVTDTFHHKVEEVKSAFKVEERQEEGDRKPLLDVVQEGISKITHNLEAATHKIMPGQKNITE